MRHAVIPLAGTLLASLLVTAAVPASPKKTLSVIPVPAHIAPGHGELTLRWPARVAAGRGPEARRVARYFADLARSTMGISLKIAGDLHAETEIVFALVPGDATLADEGYSLDVSPRGVRVQARTTQGLFYGAITLWQLLTAADRSGSTVRLESVSVRDAPRFAWRGLMLDVARHYMPPEDIRRLLDAMAIHKLNRFHWHLTDDQGWRLEIKRYPKLTQVGAWRTPAGAAAKGGRYGGYYTQQEVRDLVRYAADRFITIVPEIEMPGHAQAAIAAYPELGTEGRAPAVSADWGVHDYLFNVEESTFEFLEHVLEEVMELFPGEHIHVGGDEAVKKRWIASPRVQRRMRELGVANETALQSYFVARIERYIRARGRTLIGWDEILEGGLSRAAAVMSWRGSEGAVQAALAGHDVVMAPVPRLYLDYLQSASADEPPGRPTYVTLADVYAFEPVPAGLTIGDAQRILGAQVNAWTEHMRTPERVQHNALPRAAALAEVLWTPADRRDWRSFLARLPDQFARYERLGLTFADTAFAPRIAAEKRGERAELVLSNQVGTGEIRYTLDGSEPTMDSPLYRSPLQLGLPARVRATTFLDGRRMAKVRERQIDAASLARRSGDELRSCEQKLPLRLEDDAPLTGARARFNIDIMDPCWIYEDADLTGISKIAAAVGQLPFNFQIGEDVHKIPLRAPARPGGELEVRIDNCEGLPIAVLPLAPALDHDAVTELPEVPMQPHSGTHDLCLTFTRATLAPMWAIEWVQLLP